MEGQYAEFERVNKKFIDLDEKFTKNKFSTTSIPNETFTVKKPVAKIGLFNKNKNPKLCNRPKFDINKLESISTKNILPKSDSYNRYLESDLLNPFGHTNLNKGKIQADNIDDDVDDIWVNERNRRGYFNINNSRAERSKKVSQIFSRNVRKHERESVLDYDSYDNHLRSFDSLTISDKGSLRKYRPPEDDYKTLQDQYDLITESAFDDRFDINNI